MSFGALTSSGFGYTYVPAVSQYSGGVVAEDGHRLERYRFAQAVPLASAFDGIRELLGGRSLPVTALCAMELRSPEPVSDAGFAAFNTRYRTFLDDWAITASGDNPVARSNVCPDVAPPETNTVHAFCIAVPGASGGSRDFVVSGSAETPEGGSYEGGALEAGQADAEAMERKAQWVTGEMERRMALLGVSWAEASAIQVYTVREFHRSVEASLRPAVATGTPLSWFYCRPPVVGLEFEMDVRRVTTEHLLPE